jgi:hypothetical protein
MHDTESRGRTFYSWLNKFAKFGQGRLRLIGSISGSVVRWAHPAIYEAQVSMQATFLYYENCPSHDVALERLRSVLFEEEIEAEIEIIRVETDEQAQQLRFIGSPTIRIDGRDIDPPGPDAYYALTCRAYQLEDGRISPLPAPEMIRRALRSG